MTSSKISPSSRPKHSLISPQKSSQLHLPGIHPDFEVEDTPTSSDSSFDKDTFIDDYIENFGKEDDMSQRANLRATTPVRRSGRLSAQGGSIAAESVITTVTTNGTKTRGKSTLQKVQPRKSNAYGSSGRLGAPEKLPTAVSGFTQAFQNQRGDAEDEDDGDDIDELAAEPPVTQPRQQARNSVQPAPPVQPALPVQPTPPAPRDSATRSRATPGYSFLDSDDFSPSEDDVAASIGNTSKSFGLGHEAGMMASQDRYDARSSTFAKPAIPRRNPPTRTVNGARGQSPTPTQPQVSARAQTPGQGPAHAPIRGQTAAQRQPTVRATPSERIAINQSVDELIAEEQARLAQEDLPQPQRQSERRRPHQKAPSDMFGWLTNVQQAEGEEDEPVWPWKRWVTWAFWTLVGLVITGWLISVAMNNGHPESALRTPSVLKAVGSRIAYTYDMITDFIAPPTGPTEAEKERAAAEAYKANGEDHLLWGRMSQIEQRNIKRMEDMRAAFEELKQELPELMVIKRHEDGSAEISDDFWRALTSKAESTDPEWVRFLGETKEKLDELFDNHAHHDRKHMEAWPQAVSRDEFISHIEAKYQNLTLEVDKKIEEAIRAQAVQIKALVKEESKRAMMDQLRLNALAEANLVANYQLRFNRPNYFSPGLGTVVDPELSSVTFNNHPGRIATLLRRASWVAARNPPMAALTKWEEPGDCWCSAPSSAEGPQAQLVVNLARPVTPKQVTIEHIPMSMMPARNISNAPRDIELWVQSDLPITPYYSHRQVACKGEGPQAAPGQKAWKCLGSFKYNIHASNHLQTFDLGGEPSEPVSKAVVRVTSNWGASHTCLYQVRLHGTDAAPDYEYGVGLMD
jgi:SUN domain-containing protein 1/2